MKMSRALGTALAIGTVAALGMSGAQAQQAGVLSDILFVNGAQRFIPEGPTGECDGFGNVAYFCNQSLGDFQILGGTAVALLDPVGETRDPAEPPCVLVDPGPGDNTRCISDIVGAIQDATGLSVVLWSDPYLPLGAGGIENFFGPNNVIYETGALQDISGLLNLPVPGFVQVQSDVEGVVPVPAAVWLFGSALGLVGVMRRKITS